MMTLFALFAVLSLLLVLYGARVYERVVARMDDGYAMRASLNYVANKLHASDNGKDVRLAELGGIDTLVMPSDESYLVCVYFSDGKLMEQYVLDEDAFLPELGTVIEELSSFEIEPVEKGFRLTATTSEGSRRTLTVLMRTGGTA